MLGLPFHDSPGMCVPRELELQLGNYAAAQCIPQTREALRQILVGSQHEVDRVTRVKVKTRGEAILNVGAEHFCGGGNRVWRAVVRQVDNQLIEILLCQRLSVYAEHVQGLTPLCRVVPAARGGRVPAASPRTVYARSLISDIPDTRTACLGENA